MIDIVFILIMIGAVVIGTSSKSNSYLRFGVVMVVGLVLVMLLAAFLVLGVVVGVSPIVVVL